MATTSAPTAQRPGGSRFAGSRPALATGAVLFLAAFVPRLLVVLLSGGLGGTSGYDASVYYASADALDHGLMPYRDYVLLHPPGITLALTPFAELGTLIGDHAGYMLATLAWMALGSLNSLLVWRIATWMGVGRLASFAGGLLYAVWWSAINAEFLIRLEPLGNTALLVGMLALARADAARAAGTAMSRRLALVCGAGFGAAAAVKIWWVVPLLLVLAWHVPTRRRGALPWVTVGAAAALLVIIGPFFFTAPRQTWSMIVLDQLGRSQAGVPLDRLLGLTGLGGLFPSLFNQPVRAWTLIGMAFVLAVVLAVRARSARGGPFVVTLLVVQLAVLAFGPSWFSFYADYIAPAAAVMVAAALRPRTRAESADFEVSRFERSAAWPAEPGRRRHHRRGLLVAVLAVGAVLMTLDITRTSGSVTPFPRAALRAGATHAYCLVSDAPIVQIELGTLSPSLERGCPNWIDVTGRTYGIDRTIANGKAVLRVHNKLWQRDLRRYLFAGDAVLLFRPGAIGVGRALRHALAAEPKTASGGGYVVYRIRSEKREKQRMRDLDLP